ncbi:coiled-coil domain-containing protein 134 isoform X3 [Sminthopsis crassicaudata]|uniref:coiled-coil domain-containing protein 134 isoform X3 n=1 Tax=Sminthopsis crassicaudata TaxID=9301 RepID=UPI003D68370B
MTPAGGEEAGPAGGARAGPDRSGGSRSGPARPPAPPPRKKPTASAWAGWVLEDSRAALVAADVFPDGPFPEDEKLKDAFSHVVENTAFFGDVALRFPKIVHHYFDRNSNWNHLIRWGISFCNQTGIFNQGTYSQLLSLMAQELGIGERSPDYRNPFTTDHSETFSATDTFQKALKDEERRRKKEEKRKEIRKGPRISRSQTEL